MREAVRRGLALRREHGIEGVASEEQIDAVLTALGLTVEERYPFRGRLRGLLVRDTVYVREDLPSRQRVWIKSHEAGHHVLHESTPVARYLRGDDVLPSPVGGRQEREAELFAAALVAGEPCAETACVAPWLEESHAGGRGVPAELLWEMVSILNRTWR